MTTYDIPLDTLEEDCIKRNLVFEFAKLVHNEDKTWTTQFRVRHYENTSDGGYTTTSCLHEKKDGCIYTKDTQALCDAIMNVYHTIRCNYKEADHVSHRIIQIYKNKEKVKRRKG